MGGLAGRSVGLPTVIGGAGFKNSPPFAPLFVDQFDTGTSTAVAAGTAALAAACSCSSLKLTLVFPFRVESWAPKLDLLSSLTASEIILGGPLPPFMADFIGNKCTGSLGLMGPWAL
jgi:hypothetical protein